MLLGAFKSICHKKLLNKLITQTLTHTLQQALLHEESMDFVQSIKTVSSWAVKQLKRSSSLYSFSLEKKGKDAEVLGATELRQSCRVQIRASFLRAELTFTKCSGHSRHWGASTRPLFLSPLFNLYLFICVYYGSRVDLQCSGVNYRCTEKWFHYIYIYIYVYVYIHIFFYRYIFFFRFFPL